LAASRCIRIHKAAFVVNTNSEVLWRRHLASKRRGRPLMDSEKALKPGAKKAPRLKTGEGQFMLRRYHLQSMHPVIGVFRLRHNNRNFGRADQERQAIMHPLLARIDLCKRLQSCSHQSPGAIRQRSRPIYPALKRTTAALKHKQLLMSLKNLTPIACEVFLNTYAGFLAAAEYVYSRVLFPFR